MSTFTDMLDQEIRVGDTVAYATGRGSSAELKVGQVRILNWVENDSFVGGHWEFEVWAEFCSPWSGYQAIPANAVKLSKPTRGRTVRLAKGSNWA